MRMPSRHGFAASDGIGDDRLTLGPYYTFLARRSPRGLLQLLSYYKFAAKMIGPGKRVLDVGCSEGFGTMLLAEFADACLGVDQDAEAIAIASDSVATERLAFEVGDILAGDIGRFDAVDERRNGGGHRRGTFDVRSVTGTRDRRVPRVGQRVGDRRRDRPRGGRNFRRRHPERLGRKTRRRTAARGAPQPLRRGAPARFGPAPFQQRVFVFGERRSRSYGLRAPRPVPDRRLRRSAALTPAPAGGRRAQPAQSPGGLCAL